MTPRICQVCRKNTANWAARRKSNHADRWVVCNGCKAQALRLRSDVQFSRKPLTPAPT